MTTTLRTILAGIGFLLFSLDLLEQWFAHSSKAMSSLLRKFTTTKIWAILTGSISTAVLQSSSVTSLITLALVGSGVLWLTQAIWVILGANIGTTLFDGLIGYIGISGGFWLDLWLITLPCIAIWGMGMIFIKKWRSFFMVILSFGLMIYSLEILKWWVSELKQYVDLTRIIWLNYRLVFLFGVGLTIVVQSSSASSLLAMTALSEWVLSFEECLAIIIWAYLGTCITIVIGAIGWSTIKKQVAASHVGFNIIFCIVTLILFKPIVALLQSIRSWIVDPSLSGISQDVQLISFFHVFAKAIWVILFYPFIDRFKGFLERLFPVQTPTIQLQIQWRSTGLSDSIKRELIEQDITTINTLSTTIITTILKNPTVNDVTLYQEYISGSAQLIQAINELKDITTQDSHDMIDTVQHSTYALNAIYTIRETIAPLQASTNPILQSYYTYLLNQWSLLLDTSDIQQRSDIISTIKTYDNTLIDDNTLSTDEITLVTTVHHAFYHACKYTSTSPFRV